MCVFARAFSHQFAIRVFIDITFTVGKDNADNHAKGRRYRQLRARRALMLFKNVLLRTRRALTHVQSLWR